MYLPPTSLLFYHNFVNISSVSLVRICLQTRKPHRWQALGAKMHIQNFEKLQSQKIAPIRLYGLGQEKSLEISGFLPCGVPQGGFHACI